ncbi:MAG: hypothetical protein H0Z39_06160 [Peptococcaceae bacterium]|nr:hypothetical protein [Peptococcaceae bacterium]
MFDYDHARTGENIYPPLNKPEVVTVVGYDKKDGDLIVAKENLIIGRVKGVPYNSHRVFLQIAPHLKCSETSSVVWVEPVLSCRVRLLSQSHKGDMADYAFVEWVK